MTLENLVTEKGPLVEIYPKLDPTTIQHAAEITEERITNQELRNQWFWTADSALYTLEKGEAILYFGSREQNLVFQNLEEATNQLIKTGNYEPSEQEVRRVLKSVGTPKSNKTLGLKLSELGLKRHNDEFSFFRIGHNQPEKLNPAQRTFAKRIYGKGKDFTAAMEMFEKAKINPRIYTLNPEYVKKQDSPIARVCWLDRFSNDSNFNADDRLVDNSNNALRGVPKNVAEGDAKNFTPEYTPEGIIQYLTENPNEVDETLAAVFLDYANKYYQSQRQ